MNYFYYLAKHFNCAIRINTGFRKNVYLEYFYICRKITVKRQLLLCLAIILSINTYSQNFNDIVKISSYYNKKFAEFEKGLNIKSTDRASKFGLESRTYQFKFIEMLINSNNDEGDIAEFKMFSKKGAKSDEIWYEITKSANANRGFIFEESFITNKDTDLYEKNISYDQLIATLRKTKESDNLLYFITFKKDGLYYKFCIVNDTFFSEIGDKYEKLQ